MAIRVLAVDDHPIVAQGLVAALAGQPEIEVVGAAGSVAEARAAIRSLEPDVVLLDLRLPDGSGADLLTDVQDQGGGPSFIVLSTFMTAQHVNAAIALGASGFLLKTSSVDAIVRAITDVVDGHPAFTAEQLRASQRAGWAPFTERERDVIEGVMLGRSNDELSASMNLSRKTIEAYLSRLYERFGVLTRTELAILAEREQWLTLPVGPRNRGRRGER